MERTLTGTDAAAVEATGALLLATAAADALGFHSAAFLLLVLAVPAAAVAGLAGLGRVVDHGRGHMQLALSAALLLAILVGTAARSPAVAEGAVPPLATAALAVAFVALAGLAVVTLLERPA